MGHQRNVKWARKHLRSQVAAGGKLEAICRMLERCSPDGPEHEQVRRKLAKLEVDARRTARWLGLPLRAAGPP